MSKRRTDRAASRRSAQREGRPQPADARAGRSEPAGRRLAAQIGLLAAVFLGTTVIAELAGAANLGVAAGIGQLAFAIALMVLLLRAP